MKHAICIAYTDISTNDKLIMLQCCIKSVKQYCNKYNIELSLVTKSKFNIGKHFGYNFGIWEKFQAAEDLDKYDRILCMDGDVLISPNAPNVFDIVPYNKIGAVYEDVGSRKQDRLRQIQLAQQQLGPTPNNWCQNYFNAGIMIL